MPQKVAVVGGTPTWRRGVGAGLAEAGFGVVDHAALAEWRVGRSGVAVVMALDAEGAVQEAADFNVQQPDIPLVAVIGDLTVQSFAEAIRAGAVTAIDDHDELDRVVAAVGAAIKGVALIAPTLVRSMAARIPRSSDPNDWVSSDEAGWLRELGKGSSVADLAEQTGYSEREMFRTLRDLYARIGVASRTEAIIWATRMGLFDEAGV